jgi:hypothetical protein
MEIRAWVPALLWKGLILVVLFLIPPAAGASPDQNFSSGPDRVRAGSMPTFKKDELLVRFKKGIGKDRQKSVHERTGGQVRRAYRMLDGLSVIKVPKGKKLEAMLSLYRGEPDVLYVQPNYVYRAQTIPNDDSFSDLWGMHNTGQTGGVPDADINAPEAWDVVTGSPDTVVAVIDSGVDYNHLDLNVNIWTNPGEVPGNGIDDDGNGYVDDIHGINAITGAGDPMDDNDHGTKVAGTIAASGNDGRGYAGVNWRASIVACKFLNNVKEGTTGDAIECLDYLYDLKTRPVNPVNLVASNNSWGGPGFDQALQDAIDAHRQAGILFIAAAGNDTLDNDGNSNYPANFYLPNVVSVAATDKNDNLAWFTNFGRHTVHVAAPGDNISSTKRNNTWGNYSGTSAAAPFVTGLAALLYSQDPSRDWIALRNLIIAGGQDKPATAGTTISGKRLRALDANGVGSLSCAGQAVNSRLWPRNTSTALDVDVPVGLSVLHINCAAPYGEVIVELDDGTPMTLKDDGQGFDAAAGDGIYSAQWLPPGEGTYTFTFPGNDVITVSVERPTYTPTYWPPIETDFAYRSMQGEELLFPFAGETAFIDSPFPIMLLGDLAGYTGLFISPYGTISFDGPMASPDNIPLPAQGYQTFIAPFWDALDSAPGGGVFWAVLGAAPDRELVVEWRDVAHATCSGSVTFQVVFFENSSSVLYNYANVIFPDIACDFGLSATAGLQWSFGAMNYSADFPALRNNLALLWKSVPLTAHAGTDQAVLSGSTVILDGRASYNQAGTIVGYAWTQTAGTPVALTGADTAMPSFAAPSEGTLAFRLTITDNLGASDSDTVNIAVIPPATGATLTASPTGAQVIGSTITFTAGGVGGSGTYEYRFILISGSTGTKVQNYSPTNTWTWNTTGYAAGSYQVEVNVRNAGSTAAYEAYKTISHSLVTSSPATGATLTAGPASPQPIGTQVTFTAGGIGGSGSYEYKFILINGSTGTKVQNYSATNAWSWNTTGYAAGSYRVEVDVRNAGSSAAYEAYRTINYALQ